MLPWTPVFVTTAAEPLPVRPRLGRESQPPLPLGLTLVMKTGAGEVRAASLPGHPSAEPRPVAVMKAGDKPQIRWEIRNTDPKNAVRNVVVHFLVTREDAPASRIPAGPQRGTTMDSVLGTDLSAKARTTGNYNTPIFEPGTYLVEIEILDPQGNRRQFAALDLKVEEGR